MALTATLHTLQIDLNDADRGIYQTLELRVARHPSETLPYMLSRILAYCLYWEAEISFSRGLSTTDEPAVWVKAPDGRITLWIDVGHPSAERLHKASKAAQQVVVCTPQDPAAFRKTIAGARIHKADQIALVGLPVAVLEPLALQVERRMDWSVTITDNNLYLSTQGQQTLVGEITRTTLSV